MKSRSRTLAGKSIDAMLAAIEVYNKPTFAYREESFAILAINSWELLLKARLLQLANNRLAVILSYEHRQRADGTHSEKLYRKKSRSGTYLSVGLFLAIDRLRDDFGDTSHPSVRRNLELLCEVRDNAVHFINKGFDISRLIIQWVDPAASTKLGGSKPIGCDAPSVAIHNCRKVILVGLSTGRVVSNVICPVDMHVVVLPRAVGSL